MFKPSELGRAASTKAPEPAAPAPTASACQASAAPIGRAIVEKTKNIQSKRQSRRGIAQFITSSRRSLSHGNAAPTKNAFAPRTNNAAVLRFRGGDAGASRNSTSSVDSFRVPSTSKQATPAATSSAKAAAPSQIAAPVVDSAFHDEQRLHVHADKMSLILLHKVYDLVVSFPGDDGAYTRFAGKTKLSFKDIEAHGAASLVCTSCDSICHEPCADYGKDNKPDPNTSCVVFRGRTTCKHCGCESRLHYHANARLDARDVHLDDEIGHLKHKGSKWHAMSASQAKGVVTRALYAARAKADKDFRALMHAAPSASVATELAGVAKLIENARSHLESGDAQREVQVLCR